MPADATALVAVWEDFSPHAAVDLQSDAAEADAEAAAALAQIAAEPDQRLLVGLIDDRIVGAMYLRRAPVSPIHAEMAVHTSHLHVVDRWRRYGVGRALVEAAVSWAEEKDTGHVLAVSAVSSRDANRFMARLGLAPIAVVRGAPVQVLRGKFPREAVVSRSGTRAQQNLNQVLARRRSERRQAARRR